MLRLVFAIIFLLPAIVLTSSSTLRAAIGQALADKGWEEITFKNVDPARFDLGNDGILNVHGPSSSSMLVKDVSAVAPAEPTLSWMWKVDQGVPPTNLHKKGEDDRNLSILVSFRYDPKRATFGEKAKRAVFSGFTDREIPGRVLQYVWGGEQADGQWHEQPYFRGIGKMKVLKPAGEEGEWFEQSVNLYDDYRQAFGREPTQVFQIGISSDSDQTNTEVIAALKDLVFGSSSLLQ